MRARCERHALAVGPSGCLLCRREQASGAPPPIDAATPAHPATAASSVPPTIPSAAPVLPATLAGSMPPEGGATPQPGNEPPDSAPATPTITDAPPPPTVSIRIPPLALLVPIVLIAAYAFLAYRPLPPAPRASELAAAAESTRAARDPAEPPAALDDEARGDSKAADDEAADDEAADDEAADDEAAATEPLEPPEVVAQKIAELEKSRERAQALEAAQRRVKVTLYMNERCTRCVEAKGHLIARGIFPIERDIDKDPRARARHRALTRKRGLPTIEIDGKVLVGFQPERLDKAIQRAASTRLKRKR